MTATVHLVRADDTVLLAAAVKELVTELVGDGDRSLLVEELTESSYKTDEGFEITVLVDAAQTSPFLTPRRIVVGREIGCFTKADELKALISYLEAPLDSTDLVLVWEKGPETKKLGAVNKKLLEAIQAAKGRVIDVRVPRQKKALDGWWEERVAESGANLSRAARQVLADHLGEDRSRLPAVLNQLLATFGPDHVIQPDDVRPYLGQAGDVPPWDLTDALAAGHVAKSIDNLHRMTGAGGRHPLQILASLQNHYGRMLRLDGAGVSDEKGAAALLGMKGSTFPAKKALMQSRRMGSDRTSRAIKLIAQADLDVRGTSAMENEAVLEVLVARLARLAG